MTTFSHEEVYFVCGEKQKYWCASEPIWGCVPAKISSSLTALACQLQPVGQSRLQRHLAVIQAAPHHPLLGQGMISYRISFQTIFQFDLIDCFE